MTLGTKMEKYHGVRCHSCGQTIPVPSRIATRRASVDSGPGGAAADQHFPSLNLRCRVCEKENFYKTTDVHEVAGAPALSQMRRDRLTRLQPQSKLPKTANG